MLPKFPLKAGESGNQKKLSIYRAFAAREVWPNPMGTWATWVKNAKSLGFLPSQDELPWVSIPQGCARASHMEHARTTLSENSTPHSNGLRPTMARASRLARSYFSGFQQIQWFEAWHGECIYVLA
jgi:hypothetical protein